MQNRQGIRCVLAELGEYATDYDQTQQSRDAILAVVDAIRRGGLDASVSLKLTALGASFDEDLCRSHLYTILSEARQHGVMVEFDMEGRESVDFTIDLATEAARSNIRVSVALQAYLDRTPLDLDRVRATGSMIRIVKGAYLGDISDFGEIQQSFRNLIPPLVNTGEHFSVGTHDPDLIKWLCDRCAPHRELIEFGFLKGLADETKQNLRNRGWNVMEYVPFGEHHIAYEARRTFYLHRLKELGRSPVP